ncbi:helix-turn-helix transcriptional regulator [Lysobacter sp. Root983]|uniref:helix-turn-helix transcriptional regulator n=1 Tax=Lysobacter sp. Root983 TaxID=1736613 RepID=UPI00070BADD1|nr:helix-turn-helix transcriptional regulator [Lysobacter sp. Root983]KRD73614.1 hypothetical protein ASE43_18615 [Lysobacter sp. Root983]
MAIIKTPKDLGAVIRNRRKELAWDQAKLAAEVGASRQWVIDIEKGKPRAELDLALRALHALGLSLHTESPAHKAPGSAPVNTPSPGIDINDVLNRHGPNRSTPLTVPLQDSASDWLKKINATTSSSQLARLANPLPDSTPDWLKKINATTSSSQLARLANPLPDSASDWLKKINATTSSSQLARLARSQPAGATAGAVDPTSSLYRLSQLATPTSVEVGTKPAIVAPADSTPGSKPAAKPKKTRKSKHQPPQDDEER